MKQPFETSRLVLEPIQEIHANEVYDKLQDARMYEYIPNTSPLSNEEIRQQFRKLQQQFGVWDEDTLLLNWMIRLKPENSLIGSIAISVYDTADAWISFEIYPDFWGNGYASEASKKALEVLVMQFKIEIIKARVDARNVPAINLLKNLQFVFLEHSESENMQIFGLEIS